MDIITNPLTGCRDITIDMQDILSGIQYKWMFVLMCMSIIIFIYVLFKNFVKVKPDSKYKELYDKINEELDIMVIIPAVFVLVIGITAVTGFKGV